MTSASRIARAAAARTITIWAIVRQTNDRTVAIYQGERREHVDPDTGEITEKECWHWLPARFVVRNRPKPGASEEIEIPEWLARKEGLV